MNWFSRLSGSLKLAWEIVKGSARLLRAHPKLIAPLFPVILMLLIADFGLMITPSLLLSLFIIFIVAFELMFSFVITNNMLR